MQAASTGNLDTVGQRFRQIGEQLGHLLGRAQKLLSRILARSPGIIQQTAAVDADPHLMCVEILGLQKTYIVGGHQGYAGTPGQIHGAGEIDRLIRMADAAQLKIIAIAEQRCSRVQERPRLFVPSGNERATDRAFPPAR